MRDDALRIYCALLARDPLPQQRFQEIGQRFALLATLACEAAHQFDVAHERYHEEPRAVEKAWDVNVHIPTKSNTSEKAREAALVANARDDEQNLPKSQLDLVAQIGGRR